MIGIVVGQNCEKTIEIVLKSLKDCSKLYFLDGGSTDNTIKIAKKYVNIVIYHEFIKSNGLAISIQKNYMLNFLKENHLNEWIIYLDADELLDDNGIKIIEEQINKVKDVECYDIKMRHLMHDFSQEDALHKIHRTPTRVFKITKDLYYSDIEHCTIEGMKYGNIGFIIDTQLWHLAYCGAMFDIKQRYDEQMLRYKDNSSHPKEFLNSWYRMHLFGAYPKKKFNIIELPETLLNYFNIEKDELYFANRGLEVKHFLMANQWCNYFGIDNVIEFGCGRAPYGFAFEMKDVEYTGIELSRFAVNNSFVPITQGNVLDYKSNKTYELVLAFDILEHLDYKDLNKTINNLIKHSNELILISVPVKGDPNLYADPTHKIKESKEWWIKQFIKKGLKQIETPNHFLFKNQIMIFKK